MAVGDTWIAKQTGTQGNSVITVHCYQPDGTLVDQFTVNEPSDAVLLETADYWFPCIIAANNIVVFVAGNYVYSRDALGDFHSYKYHNSTDNAAPWFGGYNNGQFYFCAVHPYDPTYIVDYTKSKLFTSPSGVVWTLRHSGDENSSVWPGLLWNLNYDAASGYYYATSSRQLYPGNFIRYYNELVVQRTANFISFSNVGNEDEKWVWYDTNIDNGQVRWLNYRDDSESYFNKAYVCELNRNGAINTIPVTNIPEDERWVSVYGSCLVDLAGVPYFILGEYNAYDTFYICKRNEAGTEYVKEGSAIAYEDASQLWYMSNYRVYNPNYGYVTLEYHNTGPGSVRIVSSNTSGVVIPLDNGEDWHCCYLETGSDFDAPFWSEYDDCQETRSDY
jgi:hypothetical protein